jgi:tRNA(fMet)-specific endonuclease VapC
MRPADIKLPSITVAELFYGAEKSRAKVKNLQRVERFVSPFEVIPFDEKACQIYGKIRCRLEVSGMPIGPMDLLIASIGLSRNYIVVSNNTKEFKRVRGLKVENWL